MDSQGKPCCVFCQVEILPEYEYLLILRRPVCHSCEEKLVRSAVDDYSYQIFMEKIKEIWFDN